MHSLVVDWSNFTPTYLLIPSLRLSDVHFYYTHSVTHAHTQAHRFRFTPTYRHTHRRTHNHMHSLSGHRSNSHSHKRTSHLTRRRNQQTSYGKTTTTTTTTGKYTTFIRTATTQQIPNNLNNSHHDGHGSHWFSYRAGRHHNMHVCYRVWTTHQNQVRRWLGFDSLTGWQDFPSFPHGTICKISFFVLIFIGRFCSNVIG